MEILTWIATHKLLSLSGLINLDYAVLLAAQQAGYTKVYNIAKSILSVLTFVVNVLANLGKTNAKNPEVK